MWVQSDDQTSPILCDSCNKMIDEETYSTHWLPCKNQHSKTKSTVPASQQKEQRKVERTAQQQQDGYPCPNCSQMVPFASIEQHTNSCQLMVECSYCNGKYPVYELEMHESTCESNQDRGELNMENMQRLFELLGNMNGNGNGGNSNGNGGIGFGNVNRNSNGNGGNGNLGLNPNLLEALLRARAASAGGGNGNGIGLSLGGLLDPTQQLLHQSLFPALRNMDQGIKKRDLNQFPTEKYNKEVHSQPKCSICMQEYQQGEQVMKVTCSHIHHAECYKSWLQRNNTCPLCKAVITPKSKPKSGE